VNERMVRTRDLEVGDVIRYEGEAWTVGAQFFEPPVVMDLSLYNDRWPFNLHIGSEDEVELASRVDATAHR
jgi:hypothetical protein